MYIHATEFTNFCYWILQTIELKCIDHLQVRPLVIRSTAVRGNIVLGSVEDMERFRLHSQDCPSSSLYMTSFTRRSHVSTASDKRWGEKAWVRGVSVVGFELVQFGAHCFLFCSILINRPPPKQHLKHAYTTSMTEKSFLANHIPLLLYPLDFRLLLPRKYMKAVTIQMWYRPDIPRPLRG